MLFILAFAVAALGQQYFVGTNDNYIVGTDTFSNFSNAAVLLSVEAEATVTHLTTVVREHDAPTARVAKLDLLCAPSAPFCRISSAGGYGQARQFAEGSRTTVSGLLNSSFTAPGSGYLQQLFTLTLDANTAVGSVSDTFVFNDSPDDIVYALNVYHLNAVTAEAFNTFQDLMLAGSSSSLKIASYLFGSGGLPKRKKT
jgi:hypothetical protein